MSQPRELLSVGIDIGTTTTQLVFSSLSLVDVARVGQIPRISITDRKILYQSEIIFTPLINPETIDVDQLVEFIRTQYATAGVLPSQVETGAAIITGETARKKNADEILKAAAGLAGDFVVTVAGPHVESIAAGRGSGAAEYSRDHFTTVTNVDIGGGSANSAQFKQGTLIAASAMNIGGRVIGLDPVNGVINQINPPGQTLLNELDFQLKIGDSIQLREIHSICNRMCDLVIELIEGKSSPLAQKLYLTPPAQVSAKGKTILFSGGVGTCYYQNQLANSITEVGRYGDIGPAFAHAMHLHPGIQAYTIVEPSETMRATVLGAASQLITLSGSTIWAEAGILPLRNVPVIRPKPENPGDPTQLPVAIASAVSQWDINSATDPFAISIAIEQSLDFNGLNDFARGISSFAQSLPPGKPLIIIIKHDYAQALGQSIRSLQDPHPLLVIDQIGLEEGDYIDIGTPLMDGRVVPLSVKTLIFYHA